MKIAEIVDHFDSRMPRAWAESWDNVGLLVGDRNDELAKAFFCVDWTYATAEEAEDLGANFVLAYHPPLFSPIKKLDSSDLMYRTIRRGIAVYSPHTAFDVAPGGTNDLLAEAVGIRHPAPLRATGGEFGLGIGRVGDLAEATTLGELAEKLKGGFGLPHVLIAGSLGARVERVAVAAGAGGELLSDAYGAHAEAFVTGELRHHDALRAVKYGIGVIALLHSNSERAAVSRLCYRTSHELGIECVMSERDRDPFQIA